MLLTKLEALSFESQQQKMARACERERLERERLAAESKVVEIENARERALRFQRSMHSMLGK
jgi:hypothetical protein